MQVIAVVQHIATYRNISIFQADRTHCHLWKDNHRAAMTENEHNIKDIPKDKNAFFFCFFIRVGRFVAGWSRNCETCLENALRENDSFTVDYLQCSIHYSTFHFS